jgi:hypothetical protein
VAAGEVVVAGVVVVDVAVDVDWGGSELVAVVVVSAVEVVGAAASAGSSESEQAPASRPTTAGNRIHRLTFTSRI